ncbi:MAG: ATP synthase F1 subunit gamma [Chloroflexi bacterium]|nr:ATP synthase F1 subunit gamma [Chloroflexota bacterium]MYC00536.1 ATP synthase F1 subunit gamma [Chloroflexota bacterium]MYD54707.1 ATP synthase F1 subunit gamma [Chloroflexota bacterium]
MANTREIRRRIRSVENTAKITNAIQLVAASKMRRAQDRALQARPYAEKMQAVLGHLSGVAGDPETAHPLLERRDVNETTVILITPDRGLCGGLIANLERHTGEIVLGPEAGGSGDISMIPVGRKGGDYFQRFGIDFRASFQELGDYPGLAETQPISRIAIDDYTEGKVDRVLLVYASFVNTVSQVPVTVPILPVEPPASDEESSGETQYIFEPSPQEVLADLLPRYVDLLVYQAVLEAAASEQSARMVAMRNATDAANDMIADLTLVYNKARQEQITSELLDITGGVEALKG